jgi:hypothetical protein
VEHNSKAKTVFVVVFRQRRYIEAVKSLVSESNVSVMGWTGKIKSARWTDRTPCAVSLTTKTDALGLKSLCALL